jgi:hypothetical protein
MNLNKKNILLFSIGLFSAFYVRIIGSLIISEIIIIFLYLYLFIKGEVFNFYKKKEIRIYTKLLLLASLSCIISALFRGLEQEATLKGLFTILLLIPGFYVFYWLLKDEPYRIVYYLGGTIISTFLTVNYFPDFSIYTVNSWMSVEEAMEEQYSQIYFPYFMFAIAILYKKYPKITAFSMMGMGLFLLYGMSRKSFLFFFIAAIVLFFTTHKNTGRTMAKGKGKKIWLLLLICAGGLGAKFAYEDLASSGMLGENTQNKYEMQVSSKIGIASGRSDFFVGLLTVWHYPIVGIGFMGKTNDSRQIMAEYNKLSGESVDINSNRIYGHSSILSWWIFFGILAVPFWIYLLRQCFVFFNKNIYTYPKLTAYMLVIILSLLWDVFFSPFNNRIYYAHILVLITIINSYESKYKNKNAFPAFNSNSNI